MESWETIGLSVLVGSVLPALISLALPRHRTVQFGRAVYKAFKIVLLQKRATQLGVPMGAWSKLLMVVRTTLTDLSFGIYIESREDMADQEKLQKESEYLNLHATVQDSAPAISDQ